MQLSKDKIEMLTKKLPELYEFVLNVTSLLEADLNYIKSISKDDVNKLDERDPSVTQIDSRLTSIEGRANAMLERFKQSIKKCEADLGLDSRTSLSKVLMSKEFNENLDFNDKFIASAVAAAVSKVKN